MVRMAIRELWSRGDHRKRFPLKRRTTAAIMVAAAVVLAVLFLPGIVQREAGVIPLTTLPQAVPEIEATPPVALEIEATPAVGAPLTTHAAMESIPAEPVPDQSDSPVALKTYIEQSDPAETRYSALSELLSLWEVESYIQPYLESIKDDDTFSEVYFGDRK